jgi:hypothetical protein
MFAHLRLGGRSNAPGMPLRASRGGSIFQLKRRGSRRGGPRSQMATTASLARDRLTMSDSSPDGHRIRYMTESGTTKAIGVRALP